MFVGVVISHIQLLLKYMNCPGSTVHTQFWSLTVNELHRVQGRPGVADFCQVEQKPAQHRQEPDLSTSTALYMER